MAWSSQARIQCRKHGLEDVTSGQWEGAGLPPYVELCVLLGEPAGALRDAHQLAGDDSTQKGGPRVSRHSVLCSAEPC